jgi:hypothetical protein
VRSKFLVLLAAFAAVFAIVAPVQAQTAAARGICNGCSSGFESKWDPAVFMHNQGTNRPVKVQTRGSVFTAVNDHRHYANQEVWGFRDASRTCLAYDGGSDKLFIRTCHLKSQSEQFTYAHSELVSVYASRHNGGLYCANLPIRGKGHVLFFFLCSEKNKGQYWSAFCDCSHAGAAIAAGSSGKLIAAPRFSIGVGGSCTISGIERFYTGPASTADEVDTDNCALPIQAEVTAQYLNTETHKNFYGPSVYAGGTSNAVGGLGYNNFCSGGQRVYYNGAWKYYTNLGTDHCTT